jgi:hypothetical protein
MATTGTRNSKLAESTEPEGDEPEVVAPRTFAEVKTEQEFARMSRIDEMRAHFKKQKEKGDYVRVKVRSDSDVPVQINGYTFIIQANVPVDVPREVRDLLEEAGYI